MKINYIKIFALFAVATSCIAFSGCSTQTSYVEQNDVITDEVNINDIERSASSLVKRLLSSEILDQFEKHPVHMQVTRMLNDTSSDFDMSILRNRIVTALTSTGKIQIVSSDQMAKDIERYNAAKKGKNVAIPKLIMNGSVKQINVIKDDLSVRTYIFALNLVCNGKEIWKGEESISKKTETNAIGF